MSVTKELKLEKRSHYFRVYDFSYHAKKIIENYAKTLIHWGLIRVGRYMEKAPLKVFAASNHDRSEYRFHINALDEFLNYLRNLHISDDKIEFHEIPLREVEIVDLPIYSQWVPRDYQEPAIDYIVDPHGPRQRLVSLQTGLGKSFISMYATSQLGHRFVLVAKPAYLDKWVIDLNKTYDIPEEEFLVVQGGKALKDLIKRARAGVLTERTILLSNKTIQNYIKTYERFGKGIDELGYELPPEDLFQALGGGIRVIDEVHQDFHFNFKLDLYTHTERSVSLSATLLTDDIFIQRMHELAYPRKDRYEGKSSPPYINTVALKYQFQKPGRIKYLDYSGKTYNHHIFEQSVIKYPEVLRNYLKLIEDMVRIYFFNRSDYKAGDKFIVFCISIDMCTRVTKHLRNAFPEVDIERYVEDDPYENLMNPIGRVSTLQSAGTAVDIDRLTSTFLTIAVNSSPSNVQGFGRLRMLKDERNPTFVYFTDMDNPKHLDYHERKREIIKPKSKNFKEVNYSSLL